MCPKFMDASKRVEWANPENTYKYFPTEEPWTWEQRYPSEGPAEHGEPPSQGEWQSEGFNRWKNSALSQAKGAARANPAIGYCDDGWQTCSCWKNQQQATLDKFQPRTSGKWLETCLSW